MLGDCHLDFNFSYEGDIMNPNTKSMLQFMLVFLLASIVFMYAFMLMNDSFMKAQYYDHYKNVIDSVRNCTANPICICGGMG